MRTITRLLIGILFCASVLAQSTQYMTTFPKQENPLSEGGEWIDGRVTGLDWGSVQTLPNGTGFHATGTNLNHTTNPNYDDSTAVLAGSWSSDQSASAVVYNLGTSNVCCEEVELRLRTTITAHSITGYEFNFSVVNGNAYAQIVRWNGPLNNFTYVSVTGTNPPAIRNGDTVMAKAIGDQLTLYVNGVLYYTGIDSTYKNGSPGIGFWNSSGTLADYNDFGFQNFTAVSLGTGPQPPTNLKATVN